jgi:amino acid transporter
VFLVAAFAFGGTELVGLAAAEAEDAHKSIPTATKQVFWRISFLSRISVHRGLDCSYTDQNLLNSTGSNSKYSLYVIAIELAGTKGLLSILIITIANSCTVPLSLQGLCRHLQYNLFWTVGIHGRVQDIAFNWFLSLSSLSLFFIWAAICLAHICSRHAWKAQGRSTAELPFEAMFGVMGSWYGLTLNIICMMATFYAALILGPSLVRLVGYYLAAPTITALYTGHKIYSRDWQM